MNYDAEVSLYCGYNDKKCQRCTVNRADVEIQRPGSSRLPVRRELCKRCVSDLVEKFFEKEGV